MPVRAFIQDIEVSQPEHSMVSMYGSVRTMVVSKPRVTLRLELDPDAVGSAELRELVDAYHTGKQELWISPTPPAPVTPTAAVPADQGDPRTDSPRGPNDHW